MKFLFDLGGVFFDWDPNHFFKDIILDTKEREYFLSNICNDEWNIKQDSGRAIIEAENELIHIYPQYINEIRMYYKNHRKMIKGIFNISSITHIIAICFNFIFLSNGIEIMCFGI